MKNIKKKLISVISAALVAICAIGSVGGTQGTFIEANAASGANAKYAVQIYGIGADKIATEYIENSEETAAGNVVEEEDGGLTFGPALGDSYITYEKQICAKFGK